MENPIKMDDLELPLFSETSIWSIWVCNQPHSPAANHDSPALTVLPSQKGHHIENRLLLETTESLVIQRFSLEVVYIQRWFSLLYQYVKQVASCIMRNHEYLCVYTRIY